MSLRNTEQKRVFEYVVTDKPEDSGEAERWFRRETKRHSGMNPNTIERSDAGTSNRARKCSASSREACPERSGGRVPLAEKGVRTPHHLVKGVLKRRYASEWLPSAISSG